MRKHACNMSILFLILLSSLTGCGVSSIQGDSSVRVTFIMSLEADMFSEEATLLVRIWDGEQLEIMESTANCVASYNQKTQTEEVHCPEGIEYQEVTPEEFSFPAQEIGASIEVGSETITVGEKFRILISGLSSDNCNTTSADVVDIASSENVILEDLAWRTTLMACP